MKSERRLIADIIDKNKCRAQRLRCAVSYILTPSHLAECSKGHSATRLIPDGISDITA